MSRDFFAQLEALIERYHLLKNPFYQAWSEGKLSKECLKEYALDYYHHVLAFPTYLSALHSHTKDFATRQMVLKNLMDEEIDDVANGQCNHIELWRRFAISLGAAGKELDNHTGSPAVNEVIATFHSACARASVAEGLAALYCYESQIPAVAESKISGLQTHYHMKDPESWRYFSVHIEADKEHAAVQRELLAKHLPERGKQAVLDTSERVLQTLWNFLLDLAKRFDVDTAAVLC